MNGRTFYCMSKKSGPIYEDSHYIKWAKTSLEYSIAVVSMNNFAVCPRIVLTPFMKLVTI